MPAGAEPAAVPAPLLLPGARPELETESLGRAVGVAVCDAPPEDDPTLGEPYASTDRGAFAEPPERTVTAGDDALMCGVDTEPTGAFAVTLGAFVEPAEGTVAFTETDGAFADTVGVVTVAPVFVVEADGVVTEMLGTATVPTGALTGIVGVLTVTEGKLSEEAVGTCASATNSAEATQTENVLRENVLRDFTGRATHNS